MTRATRPPAAKARLIRRWAGWLVFFVALASAAQTDRQRSPDILLVSSHHSAVYDQYIARFQKRLQELSGNNINVAVYTPVELGEAVTRSGTFPDTDLIVTVGTDAASRVAQYNNSAPAYFTLIPRSSYSAIVDRFRQNFGPSREHSALFIDHPFDRHFALVKAVLPGVRRVGLVLGPYTIAARERIMDAAKRFGLQVVLREVHEEEHVYAAFEALLPQIDVVLALPDPQVYNRKTIRNLLITAYRGGKPIFGYSKALVKAGALASLYTDPLRVSSEAAAQVNSALRHTPVDLPPPHAPEDYSVDINFWLAESLDLQVPTIAAVEQQLRDLLRGTAPSAR